MRGIARNWDTPSKFHGNPVRNRACTSSAAAQEKPAAKGHKIRTRAESNGEKRSRNEGGSAAGFSPGAKSRQQKSTHTALKRARYALKAIHPASAPAGNGMSRSQE